MTEHDDDSERTYHDDWEFDHRHWSDQDDWISGFAREWDLLYTMFTCPDCGGDVAVRPVNGDERPSLRIVCPDCRIGTQLAHESICRHRVDGEGGDGADTHSEVRDE